MDFRYFDIVSGQACWDCEKLFGEKKTEDEKSHDTAPFEVRSCLSYHSVVLF
jgi:hypothetical protein